MSLGLINAGFKLSFAFDFDSKAVETHSKNLKHRCYVKDASKINSQEMLDEIGLGVRELDLFAGGPPCQGFSKQKRGAHLGDKRNDLVLQYSRLVYQIQPKFFLFENVAIFGQKRGAEFLKKLQDQLINYYIYPHFYNAADFGLAQTRSRFVMVGKRLDLDVPFRIPKPTVKEWLTVGEALIDLPEPPEDYTIHPDFPNHQRAKVSEANIQRFSYVPQGGGWQDIPMDIRLECHKNANTKSGGWPDVYGRLRWDGQCPTITGGFDSFTRGRYGHPLKDRPLTPREAARIQGFPDDFVFYGNRGEIRHQIGNAVPPPLAEAIGIEILRSLLIYDNLMPNSGIDEYKPEQKTLFD